MEIEVEVGAAVVDDSEAEIVGGGFEQRGKDDAAGGHTEEDECVNVISAEDHGYVGAGEGADAVLGDDKFALFRAIAGGSLRAVSDVGLRTYCNSAEETSGRPGRKPTWTRITVMPVSRA